MKDSVSASKKHAIKRLHGTRDPCIRWQLTVCLSLGFPGHEYLMPSTERHALSCFSLSELETFAILQGFRVGVAVLLVLLGSCQLRPIRI